MPCGVYLIRLGVSLNVFYGFIFLFSLLIRGKPFADLTARPHDVIAYYGYIFRVFECARLWQNLVFKYFAY